jgi:hypothetical protein
MGPRACGLGSQWDLLGLHAREPTKISKESFGISWREKGNEYLLPVYSKSSTILHSLYVISISHKSGKIAFIIPVS